MQKNTSWISYHPELVWIDWSNYKYPEYDAEGKPTLYESTLSVINLYENAFPSMSYNYLGEQFMLQWASQELPFKQENGFQSSPIKVITFTQELKNIPAYKNIQEVYKGLWNNSEVAVKDYQTLSCKLYPNPASDQITIEGSGLNLLEIFDVHGKKLSSHPLIPTSSHHLINVSHLHQGLFFVRLYSENNLSTIEKLLIAR